MSSLTLPVHPTLRHPRTGEPLRALYIDKKGRARFPIMGGDGTDDPPEGGKTDPPEGGKQDDPPAGGGGKGDDLGFPKETPVAEMTAEQQAAYWRHNARKHEGRVKDLVGDRKPEDVKADLEAYAKIQREQQTPAEQAINDARDEGKKAGITEARHETAKTVFRGALESAGIKDADVDELVDSFNVAKYVSDDGVDTTKIANFAKRFSPSGKDTARTRDFGGGQRHEPAPNRGAGGKAEAQRRFNKNKTKTGE